MDKLSRRKLALYAANQVVDGAISATVIAEIAAYLTESGRVRESELVVRAIEDELAARSVVVADVTTAYALTDAEKADIRTLIGSNSVYFRETVDPQIIGGVRVKTPGKMLDATVKTKLQALKRAKL